MEIWNHLVEPSRLKLTIVIVQFPFTQDLSRMDKSVVSNALAHTLICLQLVEHSL